MYCSVIKYEAQQLRTTVMVLRVQMYFQVQSIGSLRSTVCSTKYCRRSWTFTHALVPKGHSLCKSTVPGEHGAGVAGHAASVSDSGLDAALPNEPTWLRITVEECRDVSGRRKLSGCSWQGMAESEAGFTSSSSAADFARWAKFVCTVERNVAEYGVVCGWWCVLATVGSRV